MALNAALSISKTTDSVMHIIESECKKATEVWRREFEAQQQYIKALHAQLRKVQTERDVALADFGKARQEVTWHKERYTAAAQEQTAAGRDLYWATEARRLMVEVQSWKDKHEVAVRLRDDAERQLERTRARFSLTVVPMGPLESLPSRNRPGSPLYISTFPSTNIAETHSPKALPNSNRKRRKRSTTTYSTPAAASDPLSNETPPQPTKTVSPTSGPGHQSIFSHTTSPVAQFEPSTVVSSCTLLNPHNTPVVDTMNHKPSTSNYPPPTAENEKKWCYCGHSEYGKMVMCSSPNCAKQWFHIPCTGLKQVPKGDWFCNNCTAPKPQPT